jgi:hypothetical protein
MKDGCRTLPFVFASAALAACAGSAGPKAQVFPLELESDSGTLHVEVHTSPEPPVRGSNSAELTITNASDGTPVDGLVLAVRPWMPAMNHGTSAEPSVAAEGEGKYLVTNLYLYMPGLWELRATLSGPTGSPPPDHVAPPLQIP